MRFAIGKRTEKHDRIVDPRHPQLGAADRRRRAGLHRRRRCAAHAGRLYAHARGEHHRYARHDLRAARHHPAGRPVLRGDQARRDHDLPAAHHAHGSLCACQCRPPRRRRAGPARRRRRRLVVITLFGVFLLTLLVITTVGIVRTQNLFAAIMLMGIFSLQIAAAFFILDAADRPLTEAAVGAGIATVLLLGALALLDDTERRGRRASRLAAVVVAAGTLLILYATFDYPRLGDPAAPVHQHVAPWYIAETPRLIDTPNVVTAILASFRGYDTFGEVFVIFTAGIGVLFILANGADAARRSDLPSSDVQGLRHHLVPRLVGRLLMPFLVLFGLYIQFHGDFGPGGGFQAGALISAGLILYALVEGERAALRPVPRRVLTPLT